MTARGRLLFCSYYSYLDPASGAAQSTRDLLALLAANGWECAVLSGPELDSPDGAASVEGLFRANNIAFQYRPGAVAGMPCTLYHGVLDGVALHSFVPETAPHPQPLSPRGRGEPDPRPLSPRGRGDSPAERQPPTKEAGTAFLSLFDLVRQRFRPDIQAGSCHDSRSFSTRSTQPRDEPCRDPEMIAALTWKVPRPSG